MSVSIHHGDCLDVLRTLPAESVDAVVTDPPYGQTNEAYDGSSSASLSADVWRECARVAKSDACLVSFAGSPTYHRIAAAIEQGGWKIRQMWGWVYADGMITSAWPKEGFDRLAPALDPIVFATRGKVLLPLRREGNKVWNRPNASRGAMNYSCRSRGHGAESAVGQWPRSVFYQARTSAGTGKIGHPNAKPETLMAWLLDKVPGHTILDPFMGSGTTGAVCVKLERDFIGIEREADYIDIARARIAAAQGPLFAEALP